MDHAKTYLYNAVGKFDSKDMLFQRSGPDKLERESGGGRERERERES